MVHLSNNCALTRLECLQYKTSTELNPSHKGYHFTLYLCRLFRIPCLAKTKIILESVFDFETMYVCCMCFCSFVSTECHIKSIQSDTIMIVDDRIYLFNTLFNSRIIFYYGLDLLDKHGYNCNNKNCVRKRNCSTEEAITITTNDMCI